MTAPTVFVDLELDGFREPWLPDGRRIWEVGVIRRKPARAAGASRGAGVLPRKARCQAFVRLDELPFDASDPGESRRHALGVGRFYERHPQLASSTDSRP